MIQGFPYQENLYTKTRFWHILELANADCPVCRTEEICFNASSANLQAAIGFVQKCFD